MTGRRALLAGAAGLPLLARAAAAQVVSLDMPPARFPVKLDDSLAPGYRREVLVRWGDRVTFDARAWDPRRPTAEAASTQFGWDGRICGMVLSPPGADGLSRGVLAVAHPTVDPAMVFPDGRDRPAVSAQLQGASLLNIEKQGGRWVVVDGGYQSRRLGGDTLCRLTGPGSEAVGTAIQGLLGLSGGCATPWGTLLLAEDDPAPWVARLSRLDPRFADGTRFGWVAELDALDPASVPAKRTALARFPRGDVAAALTRDGRAVVYLSDHRAFGFLFRFVSAGPATEPDALDRGTLFAARATRQGIAWEALPAGAETALNPIAAAGQAGATAFDLPAGLVVEPRSGRLYLACKGNAARRPDQVDALNPRAGSNAGQILEIIPAGGDHGAATAAASILLLGGVPRPGAGAWPESPATLSVDAGGRLWIGTDHDGRVGAQPDILFGCDSEGPGKGFALPLYGAPRGAAIGGAAMSPDGLALFALVRTPGAEPGASFDRPGTRWPAFDPAIPPRSTLVTLLRENGGRVGG
ncbi:PhoX family phosphatase [Roseomonas sp. 18066]|uniref:PhoX family protein n=1 Tax=Roseomonas sp. 18066 TaxID=2681412 RepID=UPI0013567E42|nr:alkaline phosphatase PhoX [Roseomonas sp. 18066]